MPSLDDLKKDQSVKSTQNYKSNEDGCCTN